MIGRWLVTRRRLERELARRDHELLREIRREIAGRGGCARCRPAVFRADDARRSARRDGFLRREPPADVIVPRGRVVPIRPQGGGDSDESRG